MARKGLKGKKLTGTMAGKNERERFQERAGREMVGQGNQMEFTSGKGNRETKINDEESFSFSAWTDSSFSLASFRAGCEEVVPRNLFGQARNEEMVFDRPRTEELLFGQHTDEEWVFVLYANDVVIQMEFMKSGI